jgi:hypothetical protein
VQRGQQPESGRDGDRDAGRDQYPVL